MECYEDVQGGLTQKDLGKVAQEQLWGKWSFLGIRMCVKAIRDRDNEW